MANYFGFMAFNYFSNVTIVQLLIAREINSRPAEEHFEISVLFSIPVYVIICWYAADDLTEIRCK